VLADTFYPGWKLTIDGHPAPIYKVNRVMRGAAVTKSTHHLVYSYDPRSFQVGKQITLAGLAATLVFALYLVFRARARGVITGTADTAAIETPV
jgi:uncharacterized membrane protein YfhO